MERISNLNLSLAVMLLSLALPAHSEVLLKKPDYSYQMGDGQFPPSRFALTVS